MGKQLKAQLSLEFVSLVALAFLVMVVFIASTRSEFDELRSREEMSLVKDVAVKVQTELIIASGVEDGYLRTFELPASLDNINYTIGITNTTLVAMTEDYEYVLAVPAVEGVLKKGSNTINKTGSIIYLS